MGRWEAMGRTVWGVGTNAMGAGSNAMERWEALERTLWGFGSNAMGRREAMERTLWGVGSNAMGRWDALERTLWGVGTNAIGRWNERYKALERTLWGVGTNASKRWIDRPLASEYCLPAWKNLYGDLPPMQPQRFKVDDQVRITKKKGIFEKGCTPRWTEEIFTIAQALATQPPTYRLKDYKGEEIEGSFYEPELQRTDQDVFRIEDILLRRTKDGVKEIFVKWLGYPASFNSWVKESDWQ